MLSVLQQLGITYGYSFQLHILFLAFRALTLFVGWQERHPACKKTEWCGYLSGAR